MTQAPWNGLAVILPCVVLGAALAWFGGDAPRPISAAAAAHDATLARGGDLGMVILGNSKAHTDIDTRALTEALQTDRRVVTLNVPASSAPAWYAIAEQRVFGQGYEPELLVVYGTLASMLRVEAGGAVERRRIEDELTGESEVLSRKVFGGDTGFGARVRRRATVLHQDLLDGLRDLAVGLTVEGDGDVFARGEAAALPALDVVFGEKARFRADAGKRVIPVAEGGWSGAMKASDVAPRDTLLPDLVALARDHGARVLFVRAPLPASLAHMDSVPIAQERDALALLNEIGAGWIDLRSTPLPPEAFRDNLHLTGRGRALNTAALAAAMAAGDVLGGGLPRARAPLAAADIVREGAPPVLDLPAAMPVGQGSCGFRVTAPALGFLSDPELARRGLAGAGPLEVAAGGTRLTPGGSEGTFGEVCTGTWRHTARGILVSPPTSEATITVAASGAAPVQDEHGDDVWWVYPDTALAARFDSAWDRGAFSVRVRARLLAGTDATLSVGDRSARLVPEGRSWVASVEGPPPAAPWVVRVAAGPGTWLVVDHLRLGEADPVDVVGTVAPAATVFTRSLNWEQAAPSVTLGPEERGDRGGRRYPVPTVAHLADDATLARLGVGCSPLRIAVAAPDPAWLPEAHTPVTRLRPGKRGYLHMGADLLLPAASEVMPAGPWIATLAHSGPGDDCVWLHPGDAAHLVLNASATSQFRLGVDRLTLSGASFRPGPGGDAAVRVVLSSRGGRARTTPYLATRVMFPADGPPVTLALPIEPPVPAREPLRLDLVSLDPTASVALVAGSVAEAGP